MSDSNKCETKKIDFKDWERFDESSSVINTTKKVEDANKPIGDEGTKTLSRRISTSDPLEPRADGSKEIDFSDWERLDETSVVNATNRGAKPNSANDGGTKTSSSRHISSLEPLAPMADECRADGTKKIDFTDWERMDESSVFHATEKAKPNGDTEGTNGNASSRRIPTSEEPLEPRTDGTKRIDFTDWERMDEESIVNTADKTKPNGVTAGKNTSSPLATMTEHGGVSKKTDFTGWERMDDASIDYASENAKPTTPSRPGSMVQETTSGRSNKSGSSVNKEDSSLTMAKQSIVISRYHDKIREPCLEQSHGKSMSKSKTTSSDGRLEEILPGAVAVSATEGSRVRSKGQLKKLQSEQSPHAAGSRSAVRESRTDSKDRMAIRDKIRKIHGGELSVRNSADNTADEDLELHDNVGDAGPDEEANEETARSSERQRRVVVAPGAVAVSLNEGSQTLSKGRLTAQVGDEESVRTGNVEDSETTDGQKARANDHVATSTSPTSLPDKEKPRWWRNTKVQILLGIVVVAAVAIGVAVPLSLRSDDSSSQQQSVTPVDRNARREAVISLVSSISNEILLNQDGSPQSLALEWVIDQDEMSPIETDSPDKDQKLLQRYVLAVFFYSTGGDEWVVSRKWLDGQVDECEWRFVSCNEAGEVSSIDTGTNPNNLVGVIPDEIGFLVSIERIALQRNSISKLPDDLRKLTNLVYLDVDQNEIAGSIPSVIFEIGSLEVLFLHSNLLEGTISNSISNLSLLKELDLSSNQLIGMVPLDSLAVGLEILVLQSNDFQGNIAEIITTLPNLESLLLDRNRFSGTIPTEIGNLQNLAALSLNHNELSSTIPSEIGLLTSMTFLSLIASGLVGTIPSELSNLTNIEVIQLFSNFLSGSFPSEICDLRPPDGKLNTLKAPCSVGCDCCDNCGG